MIDFYALGWAIGEALSYGETFEPIDFKAAKKKKSCNKGYPCKGSCISARYNCRNTLEGQAKSFGDYIKSNLGKLTQGQKSAAKNIGINPKTGKQSGLTNKERVAIQKSVADDKAIKDKGAERQAKLKRIAMSKAPILKTPDGQMLLFPTSSYVKTDKATTKAQTLQISLAGSRNRIKKEIELRTASGKVYEREEVAQLQGVLDRVNRQIARQKRIANGEEIPGFLLRRTEKELSVSATSGKTGTLTAAQRLQRIESAEKQKKDKAEEKKRKRQEALATESAQTEKDRLEEAWTGKKKAPEPARSVQPTPDAAKDAPRPESVRSTQFTREVSGHSSRIAESVGRLKDGMDAGDAKQLALDISKEIGKSKKLKQGTFESAKQGGNITVTGEVAGDFGIEKDANARHSFDKYRIIYTPTGLSIGSASSQSNARAAALIADTHLSGRKLEKALSDVTNARKDDTKGSEPKESTETYTRTLEVMTMISALEKTDAGSAASYIPDDRIFRPKKSGDNPDLKKKQPEAKAPGTAKAKPKASETKQVSSPDAVVDDSLNKSGKAHDIADRPKQHVIKSGKEYQWSADVLGGKESPKFKTQREAVKELEVLAKKEQYFEYRKAKSAYQAMVDSGGVKYDGMVGRNRYHVTLPSGKKEVWKESDNDLMKEMKMPSFYSKEAQSLLYPERLLEARPQYSQDDIKTIWGGKTPV